MSFTANPMNAEALAYYLTYQFVPKPFHPKFRFPREYNPKNALRQNETQIAKNLQDHLNRVIKVSLKHTTRPVGLLLSGGLDSAILLYLLRKNTNKKIYTISTAYASDKTHLKLCASLAQRYNTIHQELIMTPADLWQLPHLYSAGLEAPIGDNGFLSTYLMFKALSSKTDILYAGDGADCLFHGLRAHYLDYLDKNYLRRLKSRAVSSATLTQKFLLPKTNYPDYEHYKYDEIFLTKNEAHKYLGVDIDLTKPLKAVIDTIKANDPIKRTILLDLNFLVANRVDYILNAATANKITIILPYLNSRLVDYVLRVPSEYFIKNSEQKYILRKAFRGNLPPEVIVQRKKGLTPPFREWYAQNRSFVLKTLRKAPALGIAPEYIRYLVENIGRSNEYAYGMRIWLILNLILWYDGQRLPPEAAL